MFLGRVIGKIWATRKDAALNGVRLLIVEPIDHTHAQTGDAFVAVAVVNASDGEIIYWVGSREAPNALPDKYGPVDAAVVGIVDRVNV